MKLSIITVCFNNKEGLIDTIQSIKKQSYRDFEFIIIDGGSTDGTLEIITQYKSLFSYWVSEKDNGIYHAMNKGIIQAKGDYCLFLNSGDYLVDENVLSNVFSVCYDEDILYGNIIKVKGKRKRVITYSEHLTFSDFYRKEPVIHHQAAFINRELFSEFGFYRQDTHIIADWIFFFDSILKGNVSTKYINEIISIFDATGISNQKTKETSPNKIKDIHLKRAILELNISKLVLIDYDKFYKGTSKFKRMKTAIKWRLSSFVSMKQFIYLYKKLK